MLQTEASCHHYQAWGRSAKGTGLLEACCYLPIAPKPQPLKEPWTVCDLGEAGSQGVTRAVSIVFFRLRDIQFSTRAEPRVTQQSHGVHQGLGPTVL